MLTQASTTITVSTRGPGFTDLTARIEEWVDRIGAREGLLTAYVRHTSASLAIQENADPDVQRDLLNALDRLAPRSSDYKHSTEGPDDMPAHIRSMLTTTSIGIPVADGPHRREVVLQFIGEVHSA